MDKIAGNPGDGVMLACPGHVYASPTGTLNDTLAGELGHAYKIFTGGKNSLQGKQAILREAGCEYGGYTKTNQSSKSKYSDDMYSHDYRTGQIRHDNTWGVNCMEPSSMKWRAQHQSDLKTLLENGDIDCIFSDSAGTFAFSQAGNHAGKPKNWKIPYVQSEFLNAIHQNLDAWQLAFPNTRFLINGLSDATINLYTPTVGMLENAFHSNKAFSKMTVVQWLDECQFLIDAQQRGWTPWVYIKLKNYTVDAPLWRNLIVPTMYLVNDGSTLFELGGVEGSSPPWITQEYKQYVYHADIGTPLTSAIQLGMGNMQSSNVWFRAFSNGFVVVNPNQSSADFQFDATDSLSKFTIAPQSGLIVRRRATYDIVR